MAAVPPGILLDAFKLPFKEAIAYLKGKGFAFSWRHEEVWKEAHTRAFTVAKVMRLDILQDIRGELEKALSEGTTFQTFLNTLEPRLKAKGWWGKTGDPEDPDKTVQLGSPHRMRNIFETNTQQSYSAGRWQKLQAVKKNRPFVRYTAILDGATRPAHRALHGKIFRVDDPALKVIGPKNGWGCRCDLVSVSQSELERDGLTVEPRPKIVEREVLISRTTGEVRPVQGVQFKSGAQFFPDAGFDYNPGDTDHAPDLSKYDKDLAAAYKKTKK